MPTRGCGGGRRSAGSSAPPAGMGTGKSILGSSCRCQEAPSPRHLCLGFGLKKDEKATEFLMNLNSSQADSFLPRSHMPDPILGAGDWICQERKKKGKKREKSTVERPMLEVSPGRRGCSWPCPSLPGSEASRSPGGSPSLQWPHQEPPDASFHLFFIFVSIAKAIATGVRLLSCIFEN